jgi:DNA primase
LVSGSRRAVEVKVEGRRIAMRNLDKVFYPEAGFTKGDVVDYYVRIAPVLSLRQRLPDATAVDRAPAR